MDILALALLLLGPVVGHGLGFGVALLLRLPRGGAGAVMPGLPVRGDREGPPAARFDREVHRVEGRLLRALRRPEGARAIEAGALAATLGEDPEVVGAILTRWRARVPVRLQVTRTGLLLHDVAAADLARLGRERLAAGPGRLGLLLLAVAGNLGAVWPLAVTAVVAGGALGLMLDETIPYWITGLVALLAVAAVFALHLAVGWLVGRLLRPWLPSPRLADAPASEGLGDRLQDGLATVQGRRSRPAGRWTWLGDLIHNALEHPGILLVAAVAAAALGALAGIVLWARGLWRATRDRDEDLADVAPGRWVREGRGPDLFAALVPTNDLAVHLVRAVRRALRRGRPGDADLPRRVHEMARRQGGCVAQVELVLAEALPPDEALAVGARLAGLAEGEVVVRETGEIDFVLPAGAQRAPDPEPVPSAPFECLPAGSPPTRVPAVAVAVPGLTLGHLRAADRLAGGTILMAAAGLVAAGVRGWHGPALLALPVLAAAVCVVAATARYAAAATARRSVLRDVRRAACRAVVRALDGGARMLDAEALATALVAALRPAWRGLQLPSVRHEIEVVLHELGLEIDPDALATLPGALPYALEPLRARLAGLEAERAQQQPVLREGDEVVFDTAES